MKSLFLAAFLCFSVIAFGQTKDDVKFKVTKHNFGKIKQNVPATIEFSFTNASTSKPLIIETATAECGCTSPEYPKGAIAKGKDGKIKVTYNAASPGAFSKKVTVKFNKIAEPFILTIEGDVMAVTKK